MSLNLVVKSIRSTTWYKNPLNGILESELYNLEEDEDMGMEPITKSYVCPINFQNEGELIILIQ